jgi:uroporphyrinogen-III decarboxylase
MVTVPEGAERFDSAWCTYHWTLQNLGKNDQGEPVRRDEWGCRQIIPQDESGAYTIVERPDLETIEKVNSHPWPDPELTNGFFESRKRIFTEHYPDRFINGFLDPGPFLIAFEILGYDRLLMKLMDDIELVKAILRIVVDYQKALVPKFKEMGAHMITIIDEIAGSTGMMFSPEVFRIHFTEYYKELFSEIHKNNMYTSILLDGNITAILPDLMKMDIDVQLFLQPLSTGIDRIQEVFRAKRAVKMGVDMMETLAKGTTEDIVHEVDEFVNKLNTKKGGLLFQALRWFRPEYDPVRVRTQIKAMNAHRQGV